MMNKWTKVTKRVKVEMILVGIKTFPE
jgi:hypothetical protein